MGVCTIRDKDEFVVKQGPRRELSHRLPMSHRILFRAATLFRYLVLEIADGVQHYYPLPSMTITAPGRFHSSRCFYGFETGV
jgi:hypothetical protein